MALCVTTFPYLFLFANNKLVVSQTSSVLSKHHKKYIYIYQAETICYSNISHGRINPSLLKIKPYAVADNLISVCPNE